MTKKTPPQQLTDYDEQYARVFDLIAEWGYALSDLSDKQNAHTGLSDQEVAEGIFEDHSLQYIEDALPNTFPHSARTPERNAHKLASHYTQLTIQTPPKKEPYDRHTATENETSTLTAHTLEQSFDIHISEDVYTALTEAVAALGEHSLEVGGLIKVHNDNGTLNITDYNLLPQEVSGSDFTITDETMHQWILDHMGDDDFHEWSGWWHSHHNMSLFWSATDNQMFTSLMGSGTQPKDTLGIVFTSDGNFLARLDIRTPYGVVQLNNLSVTIDRTSQPTNTDAIKESIRETINNNVTQRTISYQHDHNPPLTDFMLKNRLWLRLNAPTDIEDIINALDLRTTYWKDWTLRKECKLWQLNYTKVRKAVAKYKKAAAQPPPTPTPILEQHHRDTHDFQCDGCSTNTDSILYYRGRGLCNTCRTTAKHSSTSLYYY